MNCAISIPVLSRKSKWIPWIASLTFITFGIMLSRFVSKAESIKAEIVREWIHHNDAVLSALENAAYNANYQEAETAINKFESKLRALPFADDDQPTQNLIARCERAKAILRTQIGIVAESQSNTRYQPKETAE